MKVNIIEKGIVRIGAFSSVCINWMPGIIKSFYEKYPKIKIRILEGDYNHIFEWFKQGIIDIGFVTLSIGENFNGIELYKDPLMCVTPADFVPKNKTYVTIDDIKDKQIIMQGEEFDIEAQLFLKKNGLNVNKKFKIVDDASLVAIVESGIGISIIADLALKKLNFNVKIYPIEPCEYRIIKLISLDVNKMTPACKKMFNHVVSYMKDNGLINI